MILNTYKVGDGIMWSDKHQGIAKIEKLVAEYNIWELNIIPYAKFKIKIFKSSDHTYSGYSNIHIADEIGDFGCAVGYGKTEEEALEDTISEFFKLTTRKNTWEEKDFRYADSHDF